MRFLFVLSIGCLTTGYYITEEVTLNREKAHAFLRYQFYNFFVFECSVSKTVCNCYKVEIVVVLARQF